MQVFCVGINVVDAAHLSEWYWYIKFCQEAGATPLPVGEQLLCHFCAYLAKQELKFRTIKVYLSAVSHLQILNMGNDPFATPMATLEYVLRGIKKSEAAK